MLKLKWISLCYLLCAAAFADPPLRIAAQEGVSPKFIFQSNPLTGQCPDILRAIEKIDPSIRFDLDIRPTPMGRVEYGLFAGGLDAAFVPCWRQQSEAKGLCALQHPCILYKKSCLRVVMTR